MRIILGLFLVLGFSAAQADFKRGACKEDVEKFCKEFKGERHKVMKCLKEHEAELSADCKENKMAMKGKMKEIHEACEADIKAHCSDTKLGRGRMMVCLKNAPGVSEGCKAALEKKKE